MTIRAKKSTANNGFKGLFQIANPLIVFRKRNPEGIEEFVAEALPHMLVDLGCACTTISGYDAKKYLKVDFHNRTDFTYSHIAGYLLKTYPMETVMLALHAADSRPHYVFLDRVEILESEEEATDSDHLPSLLGLDGIELHTLKFHDGDLFMHLKREHRGWHA